MYHNASRWLWVLAFREDDIVHRVGRDRQSAFTRYAARNIRVALSITVLMRSGEGGGAVARITSSRLKELVITDSIQPTEAVIKAPNIRTLPIAPLIAEAIARTAAEESVSSLFD